MFQLAERRAATDGVYCGTDGLWLGPAALIRRSDAGGYQVRAGDESETLLTSAYARPPEVAGCIA